MNNLKEVNNLKEKLIELANKGNIIGVEVIDRESRIGGVNYYFGKLVYIPTNDFTIVLTGCCCMSVTIILKDVVKILVTTDVWQKG